MSDHIPAPLREFLDRILATIPVRDCRMHDLREELLAHLLAVFEQELNRYPDEPAAIAATIQRFGGDTVSDDFRTCVPFRERLLFHFFGRKEHLMWRLFLILGVVAILVGAGFICPALAQLLDTREALTLTVTLLLFGTMMAFGGVWSVVHGVKRFRMRGL